MTFIAPHYQKAKKKALFAFLRKDRFLVKTPWWLKKLFPACVWDMKGDKKKLYLSFDDGPHPVITPFVLDELKKHNAKASFFCIGENVQKHPEIYRRYIDEGHAVGNHTHHHINGWKTGDKEYLEDVTDAGHYIQSDLFRPPYGRIRRSQIKAMHKANPHQKIVMWNILAGDWVPDMAPEKCYERIKRRIAGGDIIVLHESDKAWDRMSYVLPRLLEDFSKQGYSFSAIQLK
ncbi:MAG TPA: polysaccharide deacetylase family protein [Chitinophagaceae bacterium]|nr:polysaccharide deacetylase family protein [Chitinophagaceae bacterium]